MVGWNSLDAWSAMKIDPRGCAYYSLVGSSRLGPTRKSAELYAALDAPRLCRGRVVVAYEVSQVEAGKFRRRCRACCAASGLIELSPRSASYPPPQDARTCGEMVTTCL
jgi:hypothetical protein